MNTKLVESMEFLKALSKATDIPIWSIATIQDKTDEITRDLAFAITLKHRFNPAAKYSRYHKVYKNFGISSDLEESTHKLFIYSKRLEYNKIFAVLASYIVSVGSMELISVTSINDETPLTIRVKVNLPTLLISAIAGPLDIADKDIPRPTINKDRKLESTLIVPFDDSFIKVSAEFDHSTELYL